MKKRILSLICAVLVLATLLQLTDAIQPLTVEAARSSSTIKSEIKEIKKEKAEIDAQIAELEGQLKENLEDMQDIVEQKNLIDQEIFLLYAQMENIEKQVIAYSELIADKQDELDAAQAHLAQLQEQNKARIRAMEKNGGLSYWSVIFKANSFADLLDRLKMVQEIAEADKRRLEEMSAAAEVVAQAKASLEEEKEGLELVREELEAAQAELEVKRAEADALLMELIAQGEEYEALVEEAEAAAGELNETLTDLNKELTEAQRKEYLEYLASLPKPSPSTGGTGGSALDPTVYQGITWVKPCSYTKVSSAFGWRIHPVYGDRRFHYGIDLSASSGTPIYAVRDGTVSQANYSSSGGYQVYIDHGDGFSSRYLHMTRYVVSKGQKVKAGQLIGYVGSTGVSTGPHLHFGIYYNGVAQNPATFINF